MFGSVLLYRSFVDDFSVFYSPSFEQVFKIAFTFDQIRELKELKEPFYPNKYPQGTTFVYQINNVHPSIVHFISSLPIIPSITSFNLYDPQYSALNQKRSLIRKKEEHLFIFGKIKVIKTINQYNDYDRDVIGIMREHSHSTTCILIAINTTYQTKKLHFDLHDLIFKIQPKETDLLQITDVLTSKRQIMTFAELKQEILPFELKEFDVLCYKIEMLNATNETDADFLHMQSSFKRLIQLINMNILAHGNSVFEQIKSAFMSKEKKELENTIIALERLGNIKLQINKEKIKNTLFSVFYQLNQLTHPDELKNRKSEIIGYNNILELSKDSSSASSDLCKQLLEMNDLGTIVFVTPEIGRFSTIGGIGVLINELTITLSQLGHKIVVISPYYNMNKKGEQGYLAKDGIKLKSTIEMYIGGEKVSVGVHYGNENNIDLYFLHNYNYFPMPYPSFQPPMMLKSACLFAKSSLQLLCDLKLHPSIIVTNDWFTGLVPAYSKYHFGHYFETSTFFHIVHNLEKGYIGDLYPDSDLYYIHELPSELLNNPTPTSINLSMCALKTCDNWGTVSKSYMLDSLKTSPLSYYLRKFPKPFACSNGISVKNRMVVLKKISPTLDHIECKRKLQQKYFGFVDDSIPLFGFVGRISEQKGVFLLLEAANQLINSTGGKCQFIVGGMASNDDPYAIACASKMHYMKSTFQRSFWADPSAFFTDGPLMNMGCDYTCMPSMFEPSGLVQQESFLAGTPVIAFKTGGLKDTVFEYNKQEKTGNGFNFEAFTVGDLVYAINRSIEIYHSPEDYKQLRENASKSVLDLIDVSIAWGSEFARLKKKVFTFELKE